LILSRGAITRQGFSSRGHVGKPDCCCKTRAKAFQAAKSHGFPSRKQTSCRAGA
jgi:hypothetical protein